MLSGAQVPLCILIDGWMTCDFLSFLIVFQSYQDDGMVTGKLCAMKSIYSPKDFHLRGS